MRKRLKKKKQACGLCKPHKRAMASRWKPKEEAQLKAFEKEERELLIITSNQVEV